MGSTSPSAISLLVRVACQTIAINSMERTLAQGQPSEKELEAAQQLLQKEAAEPLLWIALRGERAGMHRIVQYHDPGEFKSRELGLGNLYPNWLSAHYIKQGHARLLRMMTESVEIAQLPTEQHAPRFDELERTVQQESDAKNVGEALVGLLVPALGRIGEAYRRSQANLRCAYVALAAERYRLAHGRWPDSLDDLVAGDYLEKVPTDPCDGKPLRMRRLDDGLVIYSISFDGQDNSGKIDRTKPATAPGIDLGFRLWDVAHRRQPAPELLRMPREEPGPPGDDK